MLWGLALSFIVLILFLSFMLLKHISPKPRPVHSSELTYIHPITKQSLPFGSLSDPPKVKLSVVIPSYNETTRLPKMLKETTTYLINRSKKHKDFTFEIIIVDDGSTDSTSKTALEFAKTNNIPQIKVLELLKNRGKGGAVKQGIMQSVGELILFCDADGATEFKDLENLEKEIHDTLSVVVGSRAHLPKQATVTVILSFIIFDCGFKLFTREAALLIFPNIHVEGWIFDIEVILIAYKLNIPVTEVSVNWHEVDGSKMNIVRDAIKMLIDLLIIRCNYFFGIWTLDQKKNK